MLERITTPITQQEADWLKRNLDAVLDRLARAVQKAGRSPDEVSLVAISKWHSLGKILAVARHWRSLGGAPVFGENYIQEVQAKQEVLAEMAERGEAPALDWHFTGHLQSNKAKFAAGRFKLIHALDSLTLAQNLQKVLQKEAAEAKSAQFPHPQPVLVQVNVGQEESKSGVAPDELEEFIAALQGIGEIQIQGLMILPPFSENPEDTRPYFIRLRQMRDRLEQSFGIKLPHLSMGMSHDFEAAAEEGATLVRVGTDIFGQREY